MASVSSSFFIRKIERWWLYVVYSKYDEWIKPENLLLVQGWKRDGLTEKQVAQNMGIDRKSVV